jgi:hypothetical protein
MGLEARPLEISSLVRWRLAAAHMCVVASAEDLDHVWLVRAKTLKREETGGRREFL